MIFSFSGQTPPVFLFGLWQLLCLWRDNQNGSFWNIRVADLPAMDDLLQGIMSLWSRKVEVAEAPTGNLTSGAR